MKTNLGKARATSVAKAILLAAAVSGLMSGAAMAQQQQKPPAPNGGATRILVLDRQAILQASKVGQDVLRQRQQYIVQARNQLQGQATALQNEERALQQQLAILSPAAKKQKIDALQAKSRNLQQQAQVRQNQIDGGTVKAQEQISIALNPILKGIMQERNAQLLLDRQVVLFSNVDVDITAIAIQRLNQKMPAVKVNLVALPTQQQGRPPGK